VFEHLLWGLAQSGIGFVDNATLQRRFSGVIEAAESDLKAAISDRRQYLVEKYGPDPGNAFADVDPLDIPRYAAEVHKEALKQMEREIRAVQRREGEARAGARVSEKERAELIRLRARQQGKQRKAERKRRAAKSKRGKKGRRRKRK